MAESEKRKTSRMEVFIPILIALVSLTTALAAWRTNQLGSTADEKNTRGLVDAVKLEAFTNEDWRMAYEEATYSRDYLVQLAGVESLEASGDAAAGEMAAAQREYLLPGLQTLAGPFTSDDSYIQSSGNLDIDRRVGELLRQDSDASAMDPQGTFDLADQYYAEQRWLAVGTVLLALSLFWLGLAQISGARLRTVTALLGIAVYLFGLVWFLGTELIFVFVRGGAL